jgi:hypothetical protein
MRPVRPRLPLITTRFPQPVERVISLAALLVDICVVTSISPATHEAKQSRSEVYLGVGNVEACFLTPRALSSAMLPPKITSGLALINPRGCA